MAELIDNALQASARRIAIHVAEDDSGPTVSVLDDGRGMDAAPLRRALQFGGSERFNDRAGPGRFGMGLPNSSVSQARRVDVLTWQQPAFVYASYLDVDEIAAGRTAEVPPVRRTTLPDWCADLRVESGTLVRWSRCDRLDARRLGVITRKLVEPLGRMFRRFLWRGVALTVNGEPVRPIDPLFLHPESPLSGAVPFGDPLAFELRSPADPLKTATVTARFAELPVDRWYDLPVEDKRRMRVVGGAGISVVRADREIDYGWYFFGPKRKENYDDWWRCELSFEPELDELFGVNHSKQDISPSAHLKEVLSPDMEAVARLLNQRVQTAFSAAKTARLRAALPRLVPPPTPSAEPAAGDGASKKQARPRRPKSAGVEPDEAADQPVGGVRVETCSLPGGAVFEFSGRPDDGRLVINTDHPFYRSVYQPLAARKGTAKQTLEALLLAFVWAERGAESERHRSFYRKHRLVWGDRLADLLTEHHHDGQ